MINHNKNLETKITKLENNLKNMLELIEEVYLDSQGSSCSVQRMLKEIKEAIKNE